MLERGVARTSIEDIQQQADVSASQLYHYFRDKDALVHAVIEYQASAVLGGQRRLLDRLDSLAALDQWRDRMVDVQREHGCRGRCPLGTLVGDLAEADPLARQELASSLAQWEELLRSGLDVMRARGELPPEVDIDRLALALLAAVQGGQLLSQARRDTAPLEAALDTVIAHLQALAGGVTG
jgi:AcrR family transcriptional regulator